MTRTLIGPQLSAAQFRSVSALVKRLCGIDLHAGKRELAKARLSRRLRALRLASFDDYLRYLESDASGDELVAMLDALTTNTTCFFREPDHFVHLRDEVIPRFLQRPGARHLRIWSAGCSTGEEPYSIAIALLETTPHLEGWDARILATDLSVQVITLARQGIYAEGRLKPVSPVLAGRYFQCVHPEPPRLFQVRDAVRGLVHFAHLNLIAPWPMQGPFEAIFCRNVLIYFDKPTQQEIVRRFRQLLAPGGTLFIGHAESLIAGDHGFRYVQPTIYAKGVQAE